MDLAVDRAFHLEAPEMSTSTMETEARSVRTRIGKTNFYLHVQRYNREPTEEHVLLR